MNIVLLTSHAIAEHDDLDMFTRMGVPCYSIGGAYDPVPFEGKRPALPDAPRFPELEAATQRQRERLTAELGDPGSFIDWGKAQLAPEVIDWADTIIVHHFPERWIAGQWDRIRGKRVIWRTCGQSNPQLEAYMSRFVGLEIVRYSPKERPAFEAWGAFAGEDAMIRFGKDPDEWNRWTGSGRWVGNVTQNMAQRGDACGYPFWIAATEGLPARPAGPGSEVLPGGIGGLDYNAMRQYLRDARVYLYTGTQPASYTLGLIEAMMTGTPVVSIGPRAFGGVAPLLDTDITGRIVHDTAESARYDLRWILDDDKVAVQTSYDLRARAIELFGLGFVMHQWADFLGVTIPRQAVTA